MQIFHQLKNYIEDHEFHMDIFADKIHIANYTKILSLGTDKVIIMVPNKKITLYGQSFSLNKLLDEEILLEGILTSLEIKNE